MQYNLAPYTSMRDILIDFINDWSRKVMASKVFQKQEKSLNFYDQPKSQNPTYCFFFYLSLQSLHY